MSFGKHTFNLINKVGSSSFQVSASCLERLQASSVLEISRVASGLKRRTKYRFLERITGKVLACGFEKIPEKKKVYIGKIVPDLVQAAHKRIWLNY